MSTSVVMPGKPLPIYGQRLAEKDIKTRIDEGKLIEWRILEIVRYRMLKAKRNVTLRAATLEEDLGGTDGVFVENGVEYLHQSKSRQRDYNDIGVEVCRYYYGRIEDLTVSPGRDKKPYDFYNCLSWTARGDAVIYHINGNHQRALIGRMVAELTKWLSEDRPYMGVFRTYVCETVGNSSIHMVKDPKDGHPKLIAYVRPSAYSPEHIIQYQCTPTELRYIYEGTWTA